MKLKFLVEEDVVNYKKTSMFIGFPHCTLKCGADCQNKHLLKELNICYNIDGIILRYINNPLTSAIVMGGLEPFDDWEDLKKLIESFRAVTKDDIVIYTGYYEEEIDKEYLEWIKEQSIKGTIIIKFGRYIPNTEKIFNEDLGVTLSSNNQYTKKYENNN